MDLPARVLDPAPVTSLAEHLDAGGGRGLDAARRLGTDGTIEELEAAGLRGRGGAGFPTGTKWRSVATATTEQSPATVVVNGAEGEPGCFKDRTLLARNPYRVLEGAVVAAEALGAHRAVVAVAESSVEVATRLEAAIQEVEDEGWTEEVPVVVARIPDRYLSGEETALLEVLAGREPFPRIAPPYRLGVDVHGTDPLHPAGTVMAAEGEATPAPPALVNNVETIAHVAMILAEGPSWFRSVGTVETPGTTVVTISGSTERDGVAEVPTGTPLAAAIELVGGGVPRGATCALPGVSAPLLPAERFDTPLCFTAMRAAGSNLGAGGFLVYDDQVSPLAIAAGVSRFLAVESCGQCRPCKHDGVGIAEHLRRLGRAGGADDLAGAQRLLDTVADGARCFLAEQHQQVVSSLLRHFPDEVRAHAARTTAVDPEVIAPILRIEDGAAILDSDYTTRQPDWTTDAPWTGLSPAERIDQSVTIG